MIDCKTGLEWKREWEGSSRELARFHGFQISVWPLSEKIIEMEVSWGGFPKQVSFSSYASMELAKQAAEDFYAALSAALREESRKQSRAMYESSVVNLNKALDAIKASTVTWDS